MDATISSADADRFSAVAATSSMEVAIFAIDDDVSSAAPVRSPAFSARPCIEREISSTVFAVSVTEDESAVVSSLTVLMDAATWIMDVETC